MTFISRALFKFSRVQVVLGVYLIALIDMTLRSHRFFSSDYSGIESSWLMLKLLGLQGFDSRLYLAYLSPIFILLGCLLFLFLKKQWARVLFSLLALTVVGIQYIESGGHSRHLLFLSSVFFALIPGDLDEGNENLDFFIRCAQLQVFIIYGLAGFWKLYYFLGDSGGLVIGADYLRYSIASQFLNANSISPLAEWFIQPSFLSLALFVVMMLVQFGSFIASCFSRLYFFWGLILVIFHIGALTSVGVFFEWAMFTILILLCMAPTTNYSNWDFVKEVKSILPKKA